MGHAVNLRRPWILAAVAVVGCGGGGGSLIPPGMPHVQQTHSSALAVSPDHSRLYVVHPDADSLSILDAAQRTILREIVLAAAPPTLDASGRYEPAVGPRALALSSTGNTLYVTGQRSGSLYALDAASGALEGRPLFVCAEPIGVLVSADDANVFVACAQDDEIVEVRSDLSAVVATVPCPRKPWALAWATDGLTLLATHLLGPGVSTLATTPLALEATWPLADGPPRLDPDTGAEDPTEPHGPVRGVYDVVARPGTSEVWVAHIMLGIDTPQPALDFQETVFPSLSILDGDGGGQLARLSVLANPGDEGAFGDIVSGPHALAFSEDGQLAFLADTNSEDVLIVDAERRIESQIIRPLPGHLPEGIVVAGSELYIQERNTEDIAAFSLTRTAQGLSVAPDGPAFATLSVDPMPASLRLGQQLFYSANSDDLPLTSNHWVACASCHLEGRSDAVTWLFAQGPRDTPTNAGGLLDTGFLFRTADRIQVQDYWRTINIEQGGHFSITDSSQHAQLDALAAFVNSAIATPVPPSTDATHLIQGPALVDLRTRGEAVFSQLGCGSCHSGPAKTDSGAGNPTLDLTGPVVTSSTSGGVLLHDVGTCVLTGAFADLAHQDIEGDPRDGCAFDTPALRGLWDSAPYLHDGSALTLEAAVSTMLGPAAAAGGSATPPSSADLNALVEYLRSL